MRNKAEKIGKKNLLSQEKGLQGSFEREGYKI